MPIKRRTASFPQRISKDPKIRGSGPSICCPTKISRLPSSFSLQRIQHFDLSTSPNMEEDRDLTNLGPELPEAVNREAQDAVRQPRKRFIGRRAAAERAATRGTVPENGDQTTSDALSGTYKTIPYCLQPDVSSTQTNATATNRKPNPLLHPRRPQPKSSHVPPPLKLLLRNPQNHPPHPNPRRQKHSPPIPRRPPHVRTTNL